MSVINFDQILRLLIADPNARVICCSNERRITYTFIALNTVYHLNYLQVETLLTRLLVKPAKPSYFAGFDVHILKLNNKDRAKKFVRVISSKLPIIPKGDCLIYSVSRTLTFNRDWEITYYSLESYFPATYACIIDKQSTLVANAGTVTIGKIQKEAEAYKHSKLVLSRLVKTSGELADFERPQCHAHPRFR